jgi:hypothetical protein
MPTDPADRLAGGAGEAPWWHGAALRQAISDGGDWQPLWTLLYGVALTTAEPAAEDEQETDLDGEAGAPGQPVAGIMDANAHLAAGEGAR